MPESAAWRPRRRRCGAIPLIAAAAVLTACTERTPGNEASLAPTATSGSQDWTTQADVMSPILIKALTPDPIPVRGSDEKFHAAYELTVLNFSPRPATITEVETLAPDGAVLSTLSEQQVGARTMIVADYAPAPPSAEASASPPERLRSSCSR